MALCALASLLEGGGCGLPADGGSVVFVLLRLSFVVHSLSYGMCRDSSLREGAEGINAEIN